jgi:hypothetical protein
MKSKIFYATTAVCIIATATISLSFRNNTISTSANQALDNFKNISVGGCWDVFVTNGSTSEIRMEGDQAEIDKIDATVKNGTLYISLKKNNMDCKGGVKIYVSTSELHRVDLGGSGNIKLESKFTNSESMDFNVAGSGSIEGEVSSPDIDAEIAGSGNIKLTGDTKSLDIDIAGSGNFNGDGLACNNSDIDISGSGEAHVKVDTRLDVEIAGSGDVYYTGEPTITKSIAGSGRVRKN